MPPATNARRPPLREAVFVQQSSLSAQEAEHNEAQGEETPDEGEETTSQARHELGKTEQQEEQDQAPI